MLGGNTTASYPPMSTGGSPDARRRPRGDASPTIEQAIDSAGDEVVGRGASTPRHSSSAPASKVNSDQFPNSKKKKNIKHTSSSTAKSSSPLKLQARSPLLDARTQLVGRKIPALRVGKRVFAPRWKMGKDESGMQCYHPGVVVSHRIVGSSTTSSRPALLYDVRFDDGDRADDLEGSSVMSRKKYLTRNLKPLLRVGDRVYAAWLENPRRRATAVSWHPGVVKDYRDHEYGGRYGPIRLYDVA